MLFSSIRENYSSRSHLWHGHCFTFPHFSKTARSSHIPCLQVPSPTFVEWNSFLQSITFAQMGFRSLSFILQAYLKPTSKPATILTCPVHNLIKTSLCLDEFSSKIKEPDVHVWGEGREMKTQGTGRRCPCFAYSCAGDRAQNSLFNSLAPKPGCLLIVPFLVTSLGIEKQGEEKEGKAARRLCPGRCCVKEKQNESTAAIAFLNPIWFSSVSFPFLLCLWDDLFCYSRGPVPESYSWTLLGQHCYNVPIN